MLLNTVPYFKKTENRVCAVWGRGEIGKELEEKGIKVYYLGARSYFDLGVIGKYKKVIEDFSPDVQVNYLIHADIFGRFFARIFGVKRIVSYIREIYINKYHYYFDRFTLWLVDFLLTNSKTTLDIYQNKLSFPKKKSDVITNGVNLEIVRPNEEAVELREKLEISNDDFVLLCIARLHKYKNHDTLIKAVKRIKEEGEIKIKLLLCGVGEEKENLVSLSNELGVSGEVLFLGKRTDVYNLISISDSFVLSSNREGMSNALLEAMTIGCPCLVSANECNLELIKDGINGFTFRHGDDKDLFDKIKLIYKNRELANNFAKQARLDIENDYDIKKIIQALDDFLEKI